MTLLTERPVDLRTFQDIVDEARRLIPRYCPEWTDHNLSDPGITLVELFAWMTEMILYQLNQVPDEMYEKFLDMVGVHRHPPLPALADVSFYLSAPRPGPVTIPADTEVATDRTETQEAIVFATIENLTISPPVVIALRAWREGQGFEDYLPYVTSGLIEGPIFDEEPEEGAAFYIGLAGNLAGVSLQLRLECREMEGAHIDPRDPPLQWEYWSSQSADWAPLRLLDSTGSGGLRGRTEADPTQGLNKSGDICLNIPRDSRPQAVDGVEATWIRVRYIQKEGQGYTRSPRITGLRCEAIGGTVPARQAEHVKDEVLGQSDGSPAQAFGLRERPVLRRDAPYAIEAWLDAEVGEWLEVEDFSASGEEDRHFVVDYIRGEVRFGPSIRSRDGTSRQYGAIPRKGAVLRIPSYYSGGGTTGNVGEGAISELKTSIPYIAGVINYSAASGGLNPESLDEVKLRCLRVLKQTEAAITGEDYERLAAEVTGVGRSRCVIPAQDDGATAAGTVRVLLIPQVPEAERALAPEDLRPSPALIEAVSRHLDEHKILGSTIQYEPVEFTWIEIDVHIRVRLGADAEVAQDQAIRSLRRFLNPAKGGAEGHGLNFGTALAESQIAAVLQSLPDVVYVERVRLRYQGDKRDVSRVEASSNGLPALGRCYVLAEPIEENV